MPPGPLSAQVRALCDEITGQVGEQAADQVRQVRQRLGEPLTVAIAGRLKAGKSTLVNAMIGRRVAPTAVGECTRLVTRFRYGPADRVDVVRRDGRRVSLPLDADGMIPQRLTVPTAEIRHVDVTLSSEHLRELTVVDTPGLSSADAAVSARAARGVGDVPGAPFDESIDEDSVSAVAGAEAVVYVFTQSVRADDVRALQAFRASSARLASSPLNALGVFAKVDTLVGGAGDPWPVAGPLADAQAALLQRTVSEVVPVVGLLAETARAGRLTEADSAALRRLAALPDDALPVLLASVDLFRTRGTGVPVAARERLLSLLGLYGIGFAVAQLRADPRLSTGALVRLLEQASGFTRLGHSVQQTFRWRADAIKAGWALSRLEHLAGHSARRPDRDAQRDAVQRLLRRPEYHRLRLLDVAQRVATGAVALPPAWEHELTRLATSGDARWVLGLPQAGPGELADAAVEAANRWRAYANAGASPAQSRVAQVAHRGFHLLSQALRGQSEAAQDQSGHDRTGQGGRW